MKVGALRVVSYGAGKNSTALLLGLAERQAPPDAILFADTGNEFPETYDHLARMQEWTREHLGIEITVVHRGYHRHSDLENECHNLSTLPSKAFGYSGCSVKWKRQPMDRWVRQWPRAQEAWAEGRLVHRLIGIHAGEQRRGKIPDDHRFTYRFPLIEWGWDEQACVEAIARHGLLVPRKSACFFCPSSTKREVLQLARERPELYARAVAIEDQARAAGKLRVVQGLGRRFSWRDLVESEDPGAFPEAAVEACVSCWDPYDAEYAQAEDDADSQGGQ